MKNNRGVTLVALVVIIVLLLVFAVVAIYTARDSYKIIDIQRYKAQMQLIQSAVDELYEEFENEYERSADSVLGSGSITKEKFIENYVKGKYSSSVGEDLKNIYDQKYEALEVTSWWGDKAANFGISITNADIQKQYYYFTKDMVKEFLGVSDINISEGFIINFQKRYVFSETPLNLKEGVIYSLYELNEEEKVIEYKVNDTNGIGRILDVDVIDVKKDYQKIRMLMDNSIGETGIISELYFCHVELNGSFEFENNDAAEERFSDVTSDTEERFEEISGINAKELTIKIKKEGKYMFKLVDSLGNVYYSDYANPISIKFHESPVLEDNLIPFIPEKDDTGNQINNKGIVYPKEGHEDINEWYNYADGRYATAVIADEDNEFYQNNKGKVFNINQSGSYQEPDGNGGGTHIVKVWIPKMLATDILKTNYDGTKFINKTGIWVPAMWDSEKNVWVPDNGNFTKVVKSFSKTKLEIGLLSTSNLKYYWKKNNESDYNELNGNTLTINATDNIMEEVKSVSIYGRTSNGNTTKVQTVRLTSENITDKNLITDIGCEDGMWTEWKEGNVGISTDIVHSGNKALFLGGFVSDSSSPRIESYVGNSMKVNYLEDHVYYTSAYVYGDTEGTTSEFLWCIEESGNNDGTLKNVENKAFEIQNSETNKWIKRSILMDEKTQGFATVNPAVYRVDLNFGSATSATMRYDDFCLVDLTELMKQHSFVKNDQEWCDTFIETNNGQTLLYYYE